jgi:hypothetical protein
VSETQLKTVTPAAVRQRRYRQRCWERSGEAYLYTECRYCGAPIKPSYRRGFCPASTGRKCRKEFFKAVQVLGVIAITATMRYVAGRVLEVAHA